MTAVATPEHRCPCGFATTSLVELASHRCASAIVWFVRVSPDLVAQLRAEPSQPVTLQIREVAGGELDFVCKRAYSPETEAIIASEIGDAIAAHDAGETVDPVARARHVVAAIMESAP